MNKLSKRFKVLVIKGGEFDAKRQDAFLKEVQKMSTVEIPNFVDLKDFQNKRKVTFEHCKK